MDAHSGLLRIGMWFAFSYLFHEPLQIVMDVYKSDGMSVATSKNAFVCLNHHGTVGAQVGEKMDTSGSCEMQ